MKTLSPRERVGEVLSTYEVKGKPYQKVIEICKRCDGCGHYSYNHMYGTTCFSCHGSGVQVVEKRVLTEKEKIQREKAKERKLDRKKEQMVQWEAERKVREEEKAQRDKEKEDRISALRAISQYQGNVGDKISVELTLMKCFTFDTQFGSKNIYLFQDQNQNTYKWSTTKNLPQKEGEQLTLNGTIKEHEEYKGQKQTVLTRCK